MSNVCYYPEECGLEVVGYLEQPDMDYEFNMLAVWKHQDTLFWGEDSGCSCPIPFEDYHFNGPEDTNLSSSFDDLLEAIEIFPDTEDSKNMLLGCIAFGFLTTVYSEMVITSV